MKPGMMETSVILGQPWQRRYNGVPNWRQEGINFETAEAKFFTPFYDDSLSVSEHSSETNSIKESQAGMLLIEPIALPARSRSKNQRGQQTWQWVKKQTQVQPIRKESTHEKPKTSIPYKSQQTKQIWVKKTLLQAQGFYQGQTSVWIPKQRLCTTNEGQEHEPKKINNQEPPQVLTNKNKPIVYRWQKKVKETDSQEVIKKKNNRDKEPRKQVWVRKEQSKLKS